MLLGAAGVCGAAGPSLAARWDFGTEETLPVTAHGGVQRDQAGPLPPEFPDFPENNTAIRLDGQGARLEIADPGAASAFDFTHGDALTLEAWVKVEAIREGQPMYVIGKGRSNSPHFARDNQNWALRVVGRGGQAHLSFLFATPPAPGREHWHRWTSEKGFHPITGWHHIAVSYRFGEPESIRGWIDGVPTDGAWDMGGPTETPPVVDDDVICIGSSQGGSPSNSFYGMIDAVAVHRVLFDNETIQSHFNRTGGPRVIGPLPEEMPVLEVPAGQVLHALYEGMPTHERWLNEDETWPDESARWTSDTFLLPRIPIPHDAWGIRDSWRAPVLLRMAADVELAPGAHRFLLRARAIGRLWVNGELVARTEALIKQPPNGEEPMTPIPDPIAPGARLPGYRIQEVTGTYTVAGAADGGLVTCRVVLETVLGGKNLRTETGETLVAVESAEGAGFVIPRPGGEALLLTDAAVGPALAQLEAGLVELDDTRRRATAASRDPYWAERHASARAWAEAHPVPAPDAGSAHPIDAFLDARLAALRASASGADSDAARHFHDQVLPVLRDGCFRCHGDKEKGGLRLNSADAILDSGDSEIPAVAPGDPGASELIRRIRSADEDLRMPPTGTPLPEAQIALLEEWIAAGADWPASPDAAAEAEPAPLLADLPFLRRLYFDTVGVPPGPEEVDAFLADSAPDKRARWIERLVADERVADHWMGYWLDLLAENPTIINQSLNSTGPFRWFLYDALRDNKPLDRLVTELILMRGATHEGGSAGFALAAENDAPWAEKGHIIASAFLGVDMQCARCHDAPYHRSTQRDLFALAAMLQRKPAAAPESSSVPDTFFASLDRPPLIRVTLKPGEAVPPEWPFAALTGVREGAAIEALLEGADDSRARLAALITAPENERFAEVMVNRIWARLMGAGIVEPVHDWEGHPPSHPELLAWLARELVANGYDMRHVMRLILTSEAYQRAAAGENRSAPPETRLFQAPDRRRLTAEQVVDAVHAVTGAPMDSDELTFVYDGRRAVSNRLTLGTPERGWMFASLANERDRPSLTLPRAQVIADVLEAFGWTGSRQKPIVRRETEPNVIQPGILANGTLAMNVTRASDGSLLADLAVEAATPEALVNTLFKRVLGRMPNAAEFTAFVDAVGPGFGERLVPTDEIVPPAPPEPLPLVTWFNHLQHDANAIQLEVERRARLGPPPDPRIRADWRERYEDAVWSLINHHEFVWMP